MITNNVYSVKSNIFVLTNVTFRPLMCGLHQNDGYWWNSCQTIRMTAIGGTAVKPSGWIISYVKLSNDPTKAIQNKITQKLKSLKDEGKITYKEYVDTKP